jgi:enoyl-CoA hydratase
VNFLVDRDDEIIPRAVSFAADNLLTASPMGLRLTKEALNFNMDAGGIDAALKFEDRNQVLSAQAQDAFEGVAAFFEKRRPTYGSR